MQELAPGVPAVVEQGEDLALIRVPEQEGTVEVPGLGVLSGSLFAGVSWGQRVSLGRRSMRVFPVTPELAFETLNRGPQVIRPLDASRIAHACGVGPGAVIVEGGVGSGALTAYLAFLVGEEGRVHGFDARKDHLATARGNLGRVGLGDRVAWHHGDLEACEVACEAFVADVPAPEAVVPAAERCLEAGGRFAAYTPLVSQVEAVRRALDEHAFVRVRSLEQLSRDWVVHERGARPSFEMLGHSGFLTFATRAVEP